MLFFSEINQSGSTWPIGAILYFLTPAGSVIIAVVFWIEYKIIAMTEQS